MHPYDAKKDLLELCSTCLEELIPELCHQDFDSSPEEGSGHLRFANDPNSPKLFQSAEYHCLSSDDAALRAFSVVVVFLSSGEVRPSDESLRPSHIQSSECLVHEA